MFIMAAFVQNDSLVGMKKRTTTTERCKIIPAKLIVFLPIFPKMAAWQAVAERSQLAATVPRKFEQA